jgi:hypothetical protein
MMKVRIVLPLTTFVLLLCAFGASAQTTTQAGLFFNISNGCSAPVNGFAVGDEVCLLQVGSAVYTRAIFQGTMVSGEKKFGMACTRKDGTASVIFVPPVSSSASAVIVTVKPNQVVSIPSTFCPPASNAASPERQLLRKK